jgi:hypothetical protein
MMMAFEKRKRLGSIIIVVVVQTVVSVRLLDKKLVGGRIIGDGRIDREVFLLDPRGRVGGEGKVVGVWLVVGMPFVVVEHGDVWIGVDGDVDGEIFLGIDEDVLEKKVGVRGVHGRAEGGVLERHCKTNNAPSEFCTQLQIPD